MATLIECVPNFSEGRDKARVDAIVRAMQRKGVYVLDSGMDADHNRSVVTLVGEREPLIAAVLAGIGKATELIDLNVHQGAHPRLGATDVVPFIPIESATLEDCVQMAKELGQKVWENYRVPVYFYEAAAVRPDRTNLEDIRRGQFEVIREEIATVESRRPDVGEPRCHPTAGAVVIGARKFLVAYNIYLQSHDVDMAKKIAKAVRFSGGGFRAVKSMGVQVRGQAQVSMNLTDTDLTPIARVFEFVKREAERYGVAVQSSEIVGLVPKRTLESAAEWFLQAENFDPSMILENRIAAVVGSTSAAGGLRAGVEPFIEQLAAPKALPAGGSAAAAAGAMAAGLAAMVAGLSRSKAEYAAFDTELTEALARLGALREELEAAIDADASAYRALLLAYKERKNAPLEQMGAAKSVAAALRDATSVPLRVAQCAAEVNSLVTELRARTSPKMVGDLAMAAALARAVVSGSLTNVEINLRLLGRGMDDEFATETRLKVAELRSSYAEVS